MTLPRPAVSISPRVAVLAVVLILAGVNVIDIRVAHASLAVGPVCAAGLLAIARAAGLSWQQLGLGPGTWRRGLTWAAVEIGAVALVIAVDAALPLTRHASRDTRYRLDYGSALLTASASGTCCHPLASPRTTRRSAARSGAALCSRRPACTGPRTR
jgi:hypothetical protein